MLDRTVNSHVETALIHVGENS